MAEFKLDVLRAELLFGPLRLIGALAVESALGAVIDLEIEVLYGEPADVEGNACVCCQSLARFQQSQAAVLAPGAIRRIDLEIAIPHEPLKLLTKLSGGSGRGTLLVLASIAVPGSPHCASAFAELQPGSLGKPDAKDL